MAGGRFVRPGDRVNKAEMQQLVGDALQVVGAVNHHELVLEVDGVEQVVELRTVLLLCGEGSTELATAEGGDDEYGWPVEVKLSVRRRPGGSDPFAQAIGN